MEDEFLGPFVSSLAKVDGVVSIVLGGSRARGTAHAGSDYDLGLYFGPGAPLDVVGLAKAIRPWVDEPSALTAVGGWGPRIVGGGWLMVAGRKVDLLYRPLAGVEAVIAACRRGDIRLDYQPGHPHVFCSAIWMGEVALCLPLHDPSGAIAELKAQTLPYPDDLSEALLRTFVWEIGFSLENATLAVARGDATHIAGCLYRALACLAQALFAAERRYLINEKGALAEAESFACSPPDLGVRVAALWSAFGAGDIAGAIDLGFSLSADAQALRASRISA